MPFDISNGLANAGTAVAATAGQYALESQKAELENQKVMLADQLAGKRESAGRQEQGLINATAADKLQTFQGGQNDLNRASEEKRTTTSANATLGSARYTADAHLQGINLEADYKKEVARIEGEYRTKQTEMMTGSRESIADKNRSSKEDIAKLQADIRTNMRASMMPGPDAINTSAENYLATGVLPSFGVGGAQAKSAILDQANKLMKERGLSPEDVRAGNVDAKTAASALQKTQQQQAALENFSGTMEKNIEIVKDYMAQGVGPTGLPVVDAWVQAGRRMTGDDDVAKFGAALYGVITEAAKINSGALGNAPLSDTQLKEVQNLVNKQDNQKTITGVLDTFTLERDNRINSINDTLARLQARAAGRANKAVPESAASTPAARNPATSPGSGTSTVKMIPFKDGRPDPSKMTVDDVYSTTSGPAKWNGKTLELLPK